jgi:hypothetical protein
VVELREQGLTYPKIAEMVGGIDRDQARQIYIKFVNRPTSQMHNPRPVCTRCGWPGWEFNPLGQNGLCLWCRVEMSGQTVRQLFWGSE